MLWTVTWYTALTVLATGLGAVPFFFVKKVSGNWLGIGNALAAGLMIGASIELLGGGFGAGIMQTVIGAILGAGMIIGSDKIFDRWHPPHVTDIAQSANLRKMILVVATLTVHSFAEGVSIGFSFANTLAFGILIALSLAVHNIPEGLAISLVLYPRGTSAWRCVWWSIFSSIPQLIAGVPAFLFAAHFAKVLPYGLGFAAGAMLWLTFKDLLPEAKEEIGTSKSYGIAALAAFAMIAFATLLG
jgi:zinc transporter ZupT